MASKGVHYLASTALRRARDAVPVWLFLPGWRARWSKKVLMKGWSLPPDLQPGEWLSIELDQHLFLTKQMTVPAAARSNITKVVDLAVRKSSPGGGANLIWRHEVVSRENQMLNLRVFQAKNAALAELLAQAEAARVRIRLVRIFGAPSAQPIFDNRKAADQPIRRWVVSSMVLAALIILWTGGREYIETQHLKDQLRNIQTQKMAASSLALEMREKIAERSENFEKLSRDIEIFKRDHKRLPVILDLTKSLDDETWVSEISFDAQRVMISGFTKNDIPGLIRKLQALPWARKVELDGPISFDNITRRSRFEILLSTEVSAGDVE